MISDLAPSRRFTIAKVLAAAEPVPDLRLAIAEWADGEPDPTVKRELDRILAQPSRKAA